MSEESLQQRFNRGYASRFYDRIDYLDDVRRIIDVAHKMGIALTPEQAQNVWREHSDTMCAGWLFLPDDDAGIEAAIWVFVDDPL